MKGSFNLFKIKRVLNSDGTCGDGNSMAIMLDHRSTTVFIGRRPNIMLKLYSAGTVLLKSKTKKKLGKGNLLFNLEFKYMIF